MPPSRLIAAALLLALPIAAAAQIVPPAPPPSEKTPPYEAPAPALPPPTPAPVHAAPPEPEAPLPSLVKADDKGKFVPLEIGVEEAAILAFAFDEQTRANIDKAIAEHHTEMDRRVIENIGLVLSVRKSGETIAGVDDLHQVATLATSLRPIRPASLLDRLMTANAITARHRARADLVIKAYNDAATAAVTKEAGEDFKLLISLSYRRSFHELSGEAVRSLDRLIGAAAPRMEDLVAGLELSETQLAAATKRLDALKIDPATGPAKDSHRLQMFRSLCFDVLTPEQVGAMLRNANPRLFKEPAPGSGP